MNVLFVIGRESSRDYPGDTPEAYWRVLLPARHLSGLAAVLGASDIEQTMRGADALWLYQPTSPAAVRLAEFARGLGKPVVCDWAEDIWHRGEQDRDYDHRRLEAAMETMALADLLVVANPRLEPVYGNFGRTTVAETVFPLSGWRRNAAGSEATIGWWSDGRQKAGFELVAPAVRRQLEKGVRVWHMQFSHHAPLVAGLDKKEARKEAGKLGAWFADDLSKNADGVCRYYRDLLAPCLVSLECYVPGSYAESVSDVPLLRAAAIGVSSLSTREHVPPGCVGSPPEEWANTLERLLADEPWRRELAQEGFRWVQTRSTYGAYQAVIAAIS